MKKTVIRILALVTLTACAGFCVSGCKKKKKSPFPEEDSFTTYTHSVEERKTADDIPLLADESEYLANIHDVPDHIASRTVKVTARGDTRDQKGRDMKTLLF